MGIVLDIHEAHFNGHTLTEDPVKSYVIANGRQEIGVNLEELRN